MDVDKLVKGIQIIVKEEVKKTLPKIVKEVVKRETESLRKENKKLKRKINEIIDNTEPTFRGHVNGNGVDETNDVGTFMDDSTTEQNNVPRFSSNPAINQVLAETAQNYQPNPNNVPPAQQPPQPNPSNPQMINEASGNPEGMEEWPTMNHNMKPQPNGAVGMNGAEAVKQNMRSQMEAEFQGQGGGGRPSPQGLGVNTGIAALDRVLNRDNSELVKKMEQQKSQPFRPGNGPKQW